MKQQNLASPVWLARFVVCLVILGGLSGNSMAQLIIAHRGASHAAPENTLAAFRLAWEQNADGIEGDFYLSKDGHIVCIHDETTGRTAGTDLPVGQSTLAQLRTLDVGSWKGGKFSGERIPTLNEVIATVPTGKRIVIELKIGPEIVAPLKRILDSSSLLAQQVIVISFHEETVAECKRRLPNIRAHWLTGFRPKHEQGPWTPTPQTIVDTVRRIKADGLGSHGRREIVNQGFVDELKAAGLTEFHVWTIDEPGDAKFFQTLGAFGITTNRPAFIREKLETKSP